MTADFSKLNNRRVMFGIRLHAYFEVDTKIEA